MDAKKYSELFSELLISLLEMEIGNIISDNNYDSFERGEYLQGQEVGLRKAIEKIKSSKFLFEE